MTERINKALTEIEEELELESAINIVICSANQIKKEIETGEPILDLIKNINSKMSIILDLDEVIQTLRKVENGNGEEEIEED